MPLGTIAEHPSRETVQSRGTGVEAYRLESGVWLANAPILVNEDFDFATAMALGAVGAGLAAGKRKQNNGRQAHAIDGLNARCSVQLLQNRNQGFSWPDL